MRGGLPEDVLRRLHACHDKVDGVIACELGNGWGDRRREDHLPFRPFDGDCGCRLLRAIAICNVR